MTDTLNTETKAKYSSLDKVPQRTIFKTLESAFEEVKAIQAVLSDTDKVEFVINGMDSDGNIDQTAWPEGYDVMVSKLTAKTQTGVDPDTQQPIYNQVPYAATCWPIPTLETILADTAGRAMVESAMITELSLRIHRPIRPNMITEGETVLSMSEGMSVSISELANLTRAATGGKLAPFDALYKAITDKLKKIAPIFAKSKMTKADYRKCLESKAYASHYYPALEDAKIFDISLQALTQLSEQSDPIIDSSLFTDWAAERENKAFENKDDDLSLDSLLGAFNEAPEAEAVEEEDGVEVTS